MQEGFGMNHIQHKKQKQHELIMILWYFQDTLLTVVTKTRKTYPSFSLHFILLKLKFFIL